MPALRIFSLLDGISYIVLLGIAMPLKYLAGMPLAVRIVGSLHGGLFVGLCLCLVYVLVRQRLSFGRCVLVFVCAFIPAAPFWLDRRLRGWNSLTDLRFLDCDTKTQRG